MENLDNIKIELSKRKFKHFVKEFWSEVDPELYIPNWVHDCLCDHLQAVYEGKFEKLVINIPPGLGKSVIVSVMFPAWVWIQDPSYSTLCGTRASGNLKRDSNKFFNLVNSKKFKESFNYFKVGSDARKENRDKISEDHKEIFNSKKGFRRAVTTGSATTGARGKIILLDDPNDRSDIFSKKDRDRINDYVFKTLSNRNFAKLGGRTVIMMQRLHKEDVSGIAIEKGYPVLSLPMEFDNNSSIPLDEWSDKRKVGEFLVEDIFDQKSKKQIVVDFGSREYETQYQQLPTSDEGSVIKRDWVKYYYTTELNNAYSYMMSWDMAFKGTDDSDFVVGQVWARHPVKPNYYLVDQIRGRWDFPKTIEMFMSFCEKWPKVIRKIVESKANGQAVIDTLKDHIPGIKPYSPKDSKESRLNSVAPLFEAGNIFLPKDQPFVDEFVEELCGFPYYKNDDQVDACVQALLNFKKSTPSFALVKSNNITSEMGLI